MVRVRIGRNRSSAHYRPKCSAISRIILVTDNAGTAAFLESWRLSLHDKRPSTIELYLDNARRFADWLTEVQRPETSPGDLLGVDRRDVEAYLASLRERDLFSSTIRSRWGALRSLYGWLADEDEIETNPMLKVKVAKAESPPPEVLTADQLGALLKVCEGTDFFDRRDTALIRFMVATGLRHQKLSD